MESLIPSFETVTRFSRSVDVSPDGRVFDDGYRNLDGNLLMKEVVALFMNCDDGWEGNHPCSLRDLGER